MKSKKILWIAAAIMIAFTLSGCFVRGGWIGGGGRERLQGNGNITSQDRPVTEFSGLQIAGAGNIIVQQADFYKVTVITDSNIQDAIEIKVSGNSLYIGQKPLTSFNPTKFEIEISAPGINEITVSGAANITFRNGKADKLAMNISGAAKIDAADYEVQNVNIVLAGASDVRIWAVNALDYNISGVGNIRYKGDPSLNGRISGLGNVNKM